MAGCSLLGVTGFLAEQRGARIPGRRLRPFGRWITGCRWARPVGMGGGAPRPRSSDQTTRSSRGSGGGGYTLCSPSAHSARRSRRFRRRRRRSRSLPIGWNDERSGDPRVSHHLSRAALGRLRQRLVDRRSSDQRGSPGRTGILRADRLTGAPHPAHGLQPLRAFRSRGSVTAQDPVSSRARPSSLPTACWPSGYTRTTRTG